MSIYALPEVASRAASREQILVELPVISDRPIQGLDLHWPPEVAVKKFDLRIRMIIRYLLPYELASPVTGFSSHIELDIFTLVQDQEDGDMVVAVGRVRPCTSGMDSDAHR